jgi:UDP-N-acetylmuramate dehydrogenase
MPAPAAPVPPAPAVSLAELTTLRLGGPALDVVEPKTQDELAATVLDLDRAGRPLLVVGGGSNLVVSDDGFAGTVVLVGIRGVTRQVEGDYVVLTAAAGEPWDDLVALSVSEGLVGIEALAGIPGLAGATPIQNVGAYGQEVSEAISGVRVLDRKSGHLRTLDPAECGFGYRQSTLRGSSRYVVLATSMRLLRGDRSGPVRYVELARALGVGVGGRAPTAEVRRAVLQLRRTKGMVLDASDPDTVSAGSFFTNPVLSAEDAARLPADAPRYPGPSGSVKISAAWLIEQAGFARGHRNGRARISSKHTLALTNTGGATTGELLDLAREIRDTVAARFGIVLTPEPVLVGCSL